MHAAPIGEIRVGRLSENELSFAVGLSHQAGWNQLEIDWCRMLSMEPHGCLLATWDGRPAGTTVCCTFDSIAWLALVLVDERLRGRGIGGQLVQAGLQYADQAGCNSVRLDATPMGRPVYERLGFVPQFELSRWSGIPDMAAVGIAPQVNVQRSSLQTDWHELARIDRQSTRTNRTKLLERLFSELSPWIARNSRGTIVGYIASRPGRMATQIGPSCSNAEAACELLQHALVHYRGQPVIVDIPSHREDLNRIVAASGLTVTRSLLRMGHGPLVAEDLSSLQISSGPELG